MLNLINKIMFKDKLLNDIENKIQLKYFDCELNSYFKNNQDIYNILYKKYKNNRKLFNRLTSIYLM